MEFHDLLHHAASRIHVHALRMHLDTPGVEATVPMLRGVWGAALRERNSRVYERVFDAGKARGMSPLYVMRPALPETLPRPAVETLLFNVDDVEFRETIWAWDAALEKGLGKVRNASRTIWRVPLGPDAEPSMDAWAGFRLSAATWPWPADEPCRLRVPWPLRILKKKELIERPTLHDIAIAAYRRLQLYSEPNVATRLNDQQNHVLAMCDGIEIGLGQWQPVDFVRWSARAEAGIEQTGVVGHLDLPGGPGPLADLLAYGLWLHAGKSPIMGMGQYLPGLL